MIISELTAQAEPRWDEYIRSAAGGLPQHLCGWQAVQRRTYGHQPHYLMASEGNKIVGVLPLFRIRSLWLGDTVRTMPGGLCAEDQTVALALIERARLWAEEVRARRFLIADARQAWQADLPTTSEHVSWLVDVRLDPEALWERLDKNIRRQIRMARGNGLRIAIDRTGRLLEDFYNVFGDFAHQSGMPLFSRRFLENVLQAFPGGFNIAIVYRDAQPLGGYFQLELGKTIYGMWGGTPHAFLKLRPVYLAYWEILRDASEQGFSFVDMGRSPAGSNASRFKGQWGGTCQPIYQQGLVFGREHSRQAANDIRDSRLFRMVTSVWPKLPLPVARYVGPRLRRYVPFA